MLSKIRLVIKWEKDITADGYLLMMEVDGNLKELVRIENIDITSVSIQNLKIYQENHFVVGFYLKRNEQYQIFRQEDYYGYEKKKKYAIYQFPIPTLKKATRQGNANVVEWYEVAKDVKYLVAKRTINGKWERVGITKMTSYIDEKIDTKTKYIYTIRCVSENGEKMLSSFSNKGVSV